MPILFTLNLHLKLVGLALIILGIAHAFFDKQFGWKAEFAKVSPFNRQMFYVHNFFIGLLVTQLGVLACFFTHTLLEPTALGRVFLCGLVMFWGCRLFIQFFIYDAKLWKGNRFNTVAHLLFSLLWCYIVGVFSWALWHQYHPQG